MSNDFNANNLFCSSWLRLGKRRFRHNSDAIVESNGQRRFVSLQNSSTSAYQLLIPLGPPPLDQEKIAEIPKCEIVQEQVDSKLQCSVCWDDFQLKEIVRQLPCSVCFLPPIITYCSHIITFDYFPARLPRILHFTVVEASRNLSNMQKIVSAGGRSKCKCRKCGKSVA